MTEIKDLIDDWSENPPLVHLVEALIYGLSGGRKRKQEEYRNEIPEHSNIPLTSRFPPPPPSVPIRGSGLSLPDRAEVMQHLPQGMQMVVGQRKESGPAPVFDFSEMQRRNQDAIAEFGRRKIG